eukprot:Lankesteria_metandrocarpae@DN8793_c0_g1_i1.p1
MVRTQTDNTRSSTGTHVKCEAVRLRLLSRLQRKCILQPDGNTDNATPENTDNADYMFIDDIPPVQTLNVKSNKKRRTTLVDNNTLLCGVSAGIGTSAVDGDVLSNMRNVIGSSTTTELENDPLKSLKVLIELIGVDMKILPTIRVEDTSAVDGIDSSLYWSEQLSPLHR